MISQTSEYALRAAIYLANRTEGSPASAQEISKAVRVPVGYLQKTLRMLAKKNIVTAQRGTGGGFTLAKVPSAISVLDILKASETQILRIEQCPLGLKQHTRLCPLHRMLDEEMARSESRFATTTLLDLLGADGGVRALCEPNAPLSVSISGPDRHRRPRPDLKE